MSDRKREGELASTLIEFEPKSSQASDSPAAHPPGGVQPQPQPAIAAYAVLGVALPLAVLVIESATRMCAEAFFDPIPTPAHAALIASVPLANGLALWRLRLRQPGAEVPLWLPVISGVGIAVAAFYALLFLPLVPLAVFAIMFYGLGLLPLGPLVALACGLRLRRALAMHYGDAWLGRRFTAGVLAGIAAIIALDVPVAATRLGLNWAISPETAQRERGLWVLRTFGDQQHLLRLAYDTAGRPSGPLSLLIGYGGRVWLDPTERVAVQSATDVREVFYRTYGIPFSSLPPPHSGRQWQRFADFDFDVGQGGEEVGGRLKGLDLVASRIDGSVNGNDAAAYLEWIFEVRNGSQQQREARFGLALPPGAVVSRATLWVNGEEREAAYGGRGEVRRAYEQVAIRQRRDPLLVTTKGGDRILAQAFPVPAGGTMKFKIGISAPLQLMAGERAQLALPVFMERNFGAAGGLQHAVWMESKTPLTAPRTALRQGPAGTAAFRLEGRIADPDRLSDRAVIMVSRDAAAAHAVARLGNGDPIVQRVSPARRVPGAVMLVIDGSARMADHKDQLLAALDRIPPSARVGLTLATGESAGAIAPALWDGAHAERVKGLLAAHIFTGGQDNAPALAGAIRTLETETDAVLLWVHAAQPVRFRATADLIEQTTARLPRLPDLQMMAVEAGPNELLPDTPWAWQASLLPIAPRLDTALGDHMARLWGTLPAFEIVRKRAGADLQSATSTGSEHIVRLWARDEVLAQMSRDAAVNREDAVALATSHRLVTPVSGAVVLETQRQFADNGLTPAAQATVPTVAEPHEWALIFIAAMMMMHLAWSRRARAGGVT